MLGRVGKSTFALLMLNGKNFAYLNFDDNQLLSGWDDDSVASVLGQVYGQYDYLLLDEIQNLPSWDFWVSKLYRCGFNLIITGSNAKMLSSEMATVLTGRYLQIEMLPIQPAGIHRIEISSAGLGSYARCRSPKMSGVLPTRGRLFRSLVVGWAGPKLSFNIVRRNSLEKILPNGITFAKRKT